MAAAAVQTSMHFLTRDPLFEKERPYNRRGEHGANKAETNAKLESQIVAVHDARDVDSTLSTHGFQRMHLDTLLEPEDFHDSDKVIGVYFPRLVEAIKKQFGASRVQIFDYTRRKRHPDYPLMRDAPDSNDVRQPAYAPHIDETYADALRVIKKLNPKEHERLSKLRWQVLIAWKPLRGPVRDWPLAVCDVRSINPETDLKTADVFEPDFTSEEYCLHYSSGQKWYYLKDQMPNEVWIMLQSDSDGRIGVPHAAFDHPDTTPDDILRESVDARMLVFYED